MKSFITLLTVTVGWPSGSILEQLFNLQTFYFIGKILQLIHETFPNEISAAFVFCSLTKTGKGLRKSEQSFVGF